MDIDKISDIYFKIFPRIIIKYHDYRIIRFVKNISARYDQEGKKLIDIGAGSCPYKKFFVVVIFSDRKSYYIYPVILFFL